MIVDYNYYSNTYLGEPIEYDEFPRYSARAEDVITAYIRVAFSALSPAQQTSVKNAICAQIEYFAWNGINAANGQTAASYSVGKVSVSGSANKSIICHTARNALVRAGLCYPGVSVC